MDAKMILETLVRIYCQQEGLTLEEFEIRQKDELVDKTAQVKKIYIGGSDNH